MFQYQGQLRCISPQKNFLLLEIETTQAVGNQSLVSFIHNAEIIWLQKAGGQTLNKHMLREKETAKMMVQ